MQRSVESQPNNAIAKPTDFTEKLVKALDLYHDRLANLVICLTQVAYPAAPKGKFYEQSLNRSVGWFTESDLLANRKSLMGRNG